MKVDEYKKASEMEQLVDLVERVTRKSSNYDVPDYYSSFMGYTIVYRLHYDDCGLLAKNFDRCQDMLVKDFSKLSDDSLKKIETREKIRNIILNKMLELNTKLPRSCVSYTARCFAYDIDLNNTCLYDMNFDSYASLLIMECEDKFLYKGPVRRLKDYFSKKRRLEYE